jgi:hypothetical protein
MAKARHRDTATLPLFGGSSGAHSGGRKKKLVPGPRHKAKGHKAHARKAPGPQFRAHAAYAAATKAPMSQADHDLGLSFALGPKDFLVGKAFEHGSVSAYNRHLAKEKASAAAKVMTELAAAAEKARFDRDPFGTDPPPAQVKAAKKAAKKAVKKAVAAVAAVKTAQAKVKAAATPAQAKAAKSKVKKIEKKAKTAKKAAKKAVTKAAKATPARGRRQTMNERLTALQRERYDPKTGEVLSHRKPKKKAAKAKHAKAAKGGARRVHNFEAALRSARHHKSILTVFPGVRRGSRLDSKTYRNPRRRSMATYANPRRRRRRTTHRRNPGMMGTAVKSLVSAGLPGAIAGAVGALVDSTVLSTKPILIRVGSKVLLAAVGGAVMRKNPVRAAGLVGGFMGTAAYTGVLKLTGGVVSGNRVSGMQELAAMAAEDEASLGLLQQELSGMGLLEEDHAAGMGEEPNLGEEEYAGMGAEPDLGDEYGE